MDFRKIWANKGPGGPHPAAPRALAALRAPQETRSSDVVVAPVPIQDPVVVGRVATDGGSSDTLEEASDCAKPTLLQSPAPQADPTARQPTRPQW